MGSIRPTAFSLPSIFASLAGDQWLSAGVRDIAGIAMRTLDCGVGRVLASVVATRDRATGVSSIETFKKYC